MNDNYYFYWISLVKNEVRNTKKNWSLKIYRLKLNKFQITSGKHDILTWF